MVEWEVAEREGSLNRIVTERLNDMNSPKRNLTAIINQNGSHKLGWNPVFKGKRVTWQTHLLAFRVNIPNSHHNLGSTEKKL